jgi:hypothetical protein
VGEHEDTLVVELAELLYLDAVALPRAQETIEGLSRSDPPVQRCLPPAI